MLIGIWATPFNVQVAHNGWGVWLRWGDLAWRGGMGVWGEADTGFQWLIAHCRLGVGCDTAGKFEAISDHHGVGIARRGMAATGGEIRAAIGGGGSRRRKGLRGRVGGGGCPVREGTGGDCGRRCQRLSRNGEGGGGDFDSRMLGGPTPSMA